MTQNKKIEAQQSDGLARISTQLNDILHNIQALPSSINPREPIQSNNTKDLCNILDRLSLTEKDMTVAINVQALLRGLHFRSRSYRHEDIDEAHKATFKWIFSDEVDAMDHTTGPTKPSSFADWLETGSGTFWMNGIPGSGKSTLMKYVADHETTRQLLEKGAGTKRVIIASHYFWNAGTPMQNSLKGLLQQLVFGILCHCPELALDMFPHRLQQSTMTPRAATATRYSPVEDEWEVSELSRGLRQVVNHPAVPTRFCFFIDGLDESSEDHFELSQMLQKLSCSENVQLCVSSRPLNVFQNAFGSRSGANAAVLCVHKHTADDIHLYVESRLQSISQWKDRDIDDAQIKKLVQLITFNAKGVFLWVSLVTKSLRDGVIDGDTFDDLYRRISALPRDLEPYFRHMLDRVDAIHHCYMAHALQVAVHTGRIFEIDIYMLLEHELKDVNYAIEKPPDVSILRFKFDAKLNANFLLRLNARCSGLLNTDAFPQVARRRVGFVHRTVRDFLRTAPMQDYLQSKVVPGFSPKLATLKAFIYLFRCEVRRIAISKCDESHWYLTRLWSDCLSYARFAMVENEAATTRLLDAVVDVQQNELSDKFSGWKHAFDRFFEFFVAFRVTLDDPSRGSPSITVAPTKHTSGSVGNTSRPGLRHTYLRAHLGPYVFAKLRNNPTYFDCDSVSLLGTALASNKFLPTDADFLFWLLEAGSDPNDKIKRWSRTTSPWHLLLIKRPFGTFGLFSTRAGCRLITAFLRHGASRTSISGHNDELSQSPAVSIFMNRTLGNGHLFEGTPNTDQSLFEKVDIHDILKVIDEFLDTTPDEKRVVLKSILGHIQTWESFPPMHFPVVERLAAIAFVDRMILMAVELGMPVEVLSPLVTSDIIRQHVTPSVLATLAGYMQSTPVAKPDSLPCVPSADSNRSRHENIVVESEHCSNRIKLSSSDNGTDPSNPTKPDYMYEAATWQFLDFK